MPLYLLKRNSYLTALEFSDTGTPRYIIFLSGALGVIIAWTYGVAVFGFFMSSLMDLFPNAISKMGDLIISALFSSALIMVLVYKASQDFSDSGVFDECRTTQR